MSGILLPQDRTQKQVVRGYCYNPECRNHYVDEAHPDWRVQDGRFEFEVENDHFQCPKCGANKGPMVGALVLIHLLTRDKMGPIEGEGGLRYKIACDAKRAYLATFTNLEAVSTAIEVANCPGCLKVIQEQKLKQTGLLYISEQK